MLCVWAGLALGLQGAAGQTTAGWEVRSTWPGGFEPGENCLSYDGSKVPDCREYINPDHYVAYFHEHSSNCSRFWECGPAYEACLVECAPCCKSADQPDNGCSKQCIGDGGMQWALTFDEEFHFFPLGPTCVFPSTYTGNCSNTNYCDCLDWQTCIGGLCSPQCVEDSQCPEDCTCDSCGWCDCGEEPGCNGEDTNCTGFDEMCNIPSHDNCFYCDRDECKPGCADDKPNCPENRPLCGANGDHRCGCNVDADCPTNLPLCQESGNGKECVDGGCQNIDELCPGFNETCNIPAHDNCYYCAGDACEPGCNNSTVNCPDLFPICGYNGHPHRCGCEVDDDCPEDHICNGDLGCIIDDSCKGIDELCPGFNETCTIPAHDNCYYCAGDSCELGCASDENCPDRYPICGHGGADHLCGCDTDDDCSGGYVCDTDNHWCHPIPGKVLVDSIKIYTASCDGCSASNEGVRVKLLGEKNGNFFDGVPCSTNVLDHQSTTDFGNGSAVFDGTTGGEEDVTEKNMMGSCYEGALNAQLNDGGEVSWAGAGTWTPQAAGGVCVDWKDTFAFAWACDLTAAGSGWQLTNCATLLPETACP